MNGYHRRVIPQQALEIILYEKRTKQHRDKGILLDFLWYDSDQLRKYREITGFKKVEIKFSREDLGFIFVLDTRDKTKTKYFRVPAVDQTYAKGLTKHQHDIIRHFRKKYLDENYDEISLLDANLRINDLLEDYLNSLKAKKTSGMQKAARYKGVGQQPDQTINASIMPEEKDSKGVSNPDVNKRDVKSKLYDGVNNTLPDELEF